MSWYTLGYVYSLNRYDRLEYLKKWLPLAEDCFEEALKCAPRDKYMVFNIAKYWVWRSQLLPKNLMSAPGDSRPETWEEGVVKFQDLFQHYLTINPDGWKDAFDSVWGTYPEDRIVFGIVPAENEELQSLIMQALAKQKS